MKSALVVAILLFLLVSLGSLTAGYHYLTTPKSADPNAAPQILEIPRGSSPGTVSKLLEERGLIEHAWLFRRMGTWLQKWPRLKAGEYELSPRLTPLDILRRLASGQVKTYSITVRPGENLYQVAANVRAKGLRSGDDFQKVVESDGALKTELSAILGGDTKPLTLEGALYPDTYFITRSMTAEEVARQMLTQFKAHWKPEFGARARAMGLSPFQLLSLASIVEKESGHPEDRTRVSAVFHNRLKKRMRLQSDPTTIYGMGARFSGNIRRADLQEKTAFNTYQIDGIPPGPISNPGIEAIEATLSPEKSDFLYFVSRNDGTTEFSRTLAEHNAAVRKFQLSRENREGKSWRQSSTKSATR